MDDLGPVSLVDTDPLVAVGSEDERLAVLQVDEIFGLLVLLRGIEKRAGVEDIAVLVDFDERGPFVTGGPLQNHSQVPNVNVDRTSDEGRLRTDGHAQGR